jgi:hypothetical protein
MADGAQVVKRLPGARLDLMSSDRDFIDMYLQICRSSRHIGPDTPTISGFVDT